MSLPTLAVKVAFSTHPTATPTWTDVSSYVRSVSIRRGRQTELDRTEAGTLTLVLANHDRRFDPSNTAGPYSPNILPVRRVQVSATHQGTTYWLFDGFVDEWRQDYHGTQIAWTTVRATDAFKILSLLLLTRSFPQQAASDRVIEVLTEIGWSIIAAWETGNVWVLDTSALDVGTILGTGGWAVYASNSSVQAVTLSSVSALSHLQSVAEAENGQFFASAAGDLVFHNRQRRTMSTNAATYSDTGGAAYGYADITLAYDESQLWNNVRVSITGSTSESVANDSTSQQKYFVRTLSKTDLAIESTAEATNAANWLLTRYREPGVRTTNVGFKLVNHSDGDGFVSAVLGREIGDRVTVVRTPPGGGAAISQSAFVEGINHDLAEPGRWVTSFNLSPAERWNFWVLDSTTQSVLDQTTILGY